MSKKKLHRYYANYFKKYTYVDVSMIQKPKCLSAFYQCRTQLEHGREFNQILNDATVPTKTND